MSGNAGFAWRPIEPDNVVDEHVFAKLKTLKIHPSEPCTDAVFVRRAYLDALYEASEVISENDHDGVILQSSGASPCALNHAGA